MIDIVESSIQSGQLGTEAEGPSPNSFARIRSKDAVISTSLLITIGKACSRNPLGSVPREYQRYVTIKTGLLYIMGT